MAGRTTELTFIVSMINIYTLYTGYLNSPHHSNSDISGMNHNSYPGAGAGTAGDTDLSINDIY